MTFTVRVVFALIAVLLFIVAAFSADPGRFQPVPAAWAAVVVAALLA